MRRCLTPLLILSLSAACGERSIPATDADTHLDDGAAPPADAAQSPDAAPRQDGACVRPPGGCFGPQDCPGDQDCKGCVPDPCCPMCAVCYGTCVSSAECWSNKDCATKGQFCQLDGGDCGKTKPGVCSPVPDVCPDGGYNPVCGCDGKTYMSPCDAHAVTISVASAGPCA